MATTANFRLDGQVALVTGAARGIGRACALALAEAGADVALGLHDRDNGGEVAAEIEALGRRALPLQMDLARLDQVRAAVEQAAEWQGHLDVLVNNVGIGPPNRAEDVSEDDFDSTVGVNLKGTFFASQAAARVMIPRKYGRIVNMSSQAGFVALPTESVYCMTKAAIAHLTKCLALSGPRTTSRSTRSHRPSFGLRARASGWMTKLFIGASSRASRSGVWANRATSPPP